MSVGDGLDYIDCCRKTQTIVGNTVPQALVLDYIRENELSNRRACIHLLLLLTVNVM